ncbi:MAG: prepilin-type N-terminal cleavage/methylation domain-containing protein [Candidatus Zixiibacteriota bacterium]
MSRIHNQHGLTLVELIIALGLGALVSVAAFEFYASQHNHMLVQENISDMQQSVRASVDEIIHNLRNAGANIPRAIGPIVSIDANPDTLEVRFASFGGSIDIGEHTQKAQANPIHVATGTNLSAYQAGDLVYFWHESQKQGEWFTVTKVSTNNGSGWEEVYHQGQDLLFDPVPGDKVIRMQQVRYFIDNSDTTHPRLMRSDNGGVPQIFADNIYDLQLQYMLSSRDTVQAVGPSDTVYVAHITVDALTEDSDFEATRVGHEGRRRRSLSTQVVLRNNRF